MYSCVYTHVCAYMCICMNAKCVQVPTETRRVHWIILSWSYEVVSCHMNAGRQNSDHL